jgi:hypothetical protein
MGRHAAGDPAFGYSAALRAAPLTGGMRRRSIASWLRRPPSCRAPRCQSRSPTRQQRGDLIAYFAQGAIAPAPARRAAAGRPAGLGRCPRRLAQGLPRAASIASISQPCRRPMRALRRATRRSSLIGPPARSSRCHLDFMSLPSRRIWTVRAKCWSRPTATSSSAKCGAAASPRCGPRPITPHSLSRTNFAMGLTQPFGLAFYPDAEHAAVALCRASRSGRALRLHDRRFGRPRRSADGRRESAARRRTFHPRHRLFARRPPPLRIGGVGLQRCRDDVEKDALQEIRDWEAQHGLGAAWDKETDRAAVLVFDVGSQQPGRSFATGLRNCVSLTRQPQTGELWCTTNERDLLGDDLVPDYSTRLKQGRFLRLALVLPRRHEDPRLAGDRPDLREAGHGSRRAVSITFGAARSELLHGHEWRFGISRRVRRRWLRELSRLVESRLQNRP